MTAIKDLSDADAGHGTLIYNGYRFGAFRNFELELVPEYDEAGRALVGNRLTITVTECLSAQAESTASTTLAALRRQLTEPGQTLVIADVGFGDLSINGTNATPPLNKTHDDIEWGPKPQVLSLKPLGGNVAWEMVWTCTAFIRDCPGTIASGLAFASFNYRSTYSRNHEGLTQRIINGTARLPQSRASGGRAITKTPDQLWDRVNIPIPLGFRRANSTHSIDEAKARLEFAVVDEELPGAAPPEHMIDVDLDYEAESVPPGFERWDFSLGGSLTVAPGRSPARAASAFWAIAFDKLRKLSIAVRPKGVVIPTKIRFGHKLFSRTSRFFIGFSVVHCLDDILRSGGIWAPIEGTSDQLWRASLADVFGPRGAAGLRQNPGNDAIVDLCGNYQRFTAGDDTRNTLSESWEPSGLLRMDGITEENSWFGYENNLRATRSESVALSKTIREYTPPETPITADGTAFEPVSRYQESAVNVEYGSSPVDMVVMHGKAMRIGFKPTLPQLVKIGNVGVTKLKQTVDGPRAISCFFGVPVYLLRWSILYKMNGHLSSLPPPPQGLCCETSGTTAEVKGGAT